MVTHHSPLYDAYFELIEYITGNEYNYDYDAEFDGEV